MEMQASDERLRGYLSRPYSRVLIPDPETSTYTARILEFAGCVAQGSTPEEAYDRLEQAAMDWLTAAMDLGQEVPAPAEEQTYSGRLLLRLPKSLHRRCAEAAATEATSLNQFVVATLAEKIGAADAARARLTRRQPGRSAPRSHRAVRRA